MKRRASPTKGYQPFENYEDRIYNFPDEELRRTGKYLKQKQFSQKFSETNMMRYIQRLSDKDVSLTNSMISLGSCTMKLNSAVCMIPITWYGFSNLHPFVPPDQSLGY